MKNIHVLPARRSNAYDFIDFDKQELEKVKDLSYYRANAEEDYLRVPINVLRYISELEQEVKTSYSELVDLLERLTPIYKEDSDLHQKFDKQRLNFIEQFKKK